MHSCALEVPPEGNLKHPTASLIPVSCEDKVREGEYHKRTLYPTEGSAHFLPAKKQLQL